MAKDLHVQIVLDLQQALKQLDELDKAFLSRTKNTRTITTKVDTTALKAAQIEFQKASVSTVLYGRKLDELNKQYGIGSVQSNNFVKSLQNENNVRKAQLASLASLKQAYKDGAISVQQYQLQTSKLINQQQLFKNKMEMATPIRNIQGLVNSISMINPALGGVIQRVQTMGQAWNSLKLPNNAMSNFGSAKDMGAYISGLSSSFGTIATTAGLATAGIVALTGAIGGFKLASSGIKAGQQFEDMEYQMAALINSSTKFKDDTTGNFVSMEKNLELSLNQSRQIIEQFVKDAPRLAGTNLEELTQTASVTLGRLASAGITDPNEQAKLIESMTVGIKTITKGQQNVAVQLAQESRALLAGEFKSTNTLINTLATNVGGKERFKQMMEDAKEAGKLGEFLNQQLEPFVRAANFAENSLSNLGEVFQDVMTNFNKKISESGGMFESFKQLTRGFLSSFIDMTEGSNTYMQILPEVSSLAERIGQSLSNSFKALLPLSKPVGDFFLNLGEFIVSSINFLNPFIQLLSAGLSPILSILNGAFKGLSEVINIFGNILQVIANILSPLINFFINLISSIHDGTASTNIFVQALAFVIKPFMNIIDGIGYVINALNELSIVFVGISNDWDKGLKFMQDSVVLWGVQVKKIFFDVINALLSGFGELVFKISKGSADLLAKAGQSELADKLYVGALKFKATAKLDTESLKKEIESRKILVSNQKKTLTSIGQRALASNTGFTGTFGGQAEEEDSKGAKKAAKQAEQRAIDEEKNRQSQIEKEYKDRILEIEKESIKLANEKVDAQIHLNDETLKHQRTLYAIEDQQMGLSLEEKKIDLAVKRGQLSERDAIIARATIKDREIELSYQKDIADLNKKQEEINLAKLDAEQKITQEKENQKKIEAENIKLQQEKASKEALLASGKLDSQSYNQVTRDITDIDEKINKNAVDLEKTKNNILNIEKQTNSEIALRQGLQDDELAQVTDRYNQQKEQQRIDTEIALTEQSSNLGDTIRDASKGFVTDLFNAFKEGGGDFGKSFLKALQNFGNKVMDALMNKLIGGLFSGGGGSSSLGSMFSGLFGGGSSGGSSLSAGQSLSRDAEGIWGVYSQSGELVKSLGTKCGIAAREMTGVAGSAGGLIGVFGNIASSIGGFISNLFGKGGQAVGQASQAVGQAGQAVGQAGQAAGQAGSAISGVAGGASGALSMAGPWGMAAGAAISVASTAFSMFSQMKKSKEEKKRKQAEEAARKYIEEAMLKLNTSLDRMDRQLKRRLDGYSDIIKKANKEIGKIDISKSIWNLQKVINKTFGETRVEVDNALIKRLEKQREDLARRFQTNQESFLPQQQMTSSVRFAGLEKMVGQFFNTTYSAVDIATQNYITADNKLKQQIAKAQKGRLIPTGILDSLRMQQQDYNNTAKKQLQLLTTQLNDSIARANDSALQGMWEATQLYVDNAKELEQRIRDLHDQIYERNRDFADEISDYEEKVAEYIQAQKELIISFGKEFDKEKVMERFGQAAGDIYDQVEQFNEKVVQLLGSGFDPEKVTYIIQRQAIKLQNDLREKVKQLHDDFAERLIGLQDELFEALTEGRATGRVQKTQQDKIAEIRRKIDELYAEQQATVNSELAGFGTNLTDANKALEYFTNQINQNYLQALEDARMGVTALDKVQINVYSPEEIANYVEERLRNTSSLPSFLRQAAV